MTSAAPLEKTAHVIRDDQEAIAIAHALAAEFAKAASERDQQRQLPAEELDQFSASGLWGITVPKEYGGAFVSFATLAEVITIISEADSSIGQIPQSHFYSVEALRLVASEEQKRFFFDLVLQGKRFGNAATELGKSSVEIQTRCDRTGSGYVVNGKKFYSTGALLADWIPVVAKNEADQKVMVFIERNTPGLTIIDDWSSMGQRTTASGTTLLENVYVPAEFVIPNYLAFERVTPIGPIAQIIQAAVDAGIARAALKDTIYFVRNHTRAWSDSGVEHAWEDPLLVSKFGSLQIQVHAAEALLRRAGEFIDRTVENPSELTVAEASIAVAEAKALTTEAALLTTNTFFELAGTKSTLEQFNYSRHWRNARTHTLHDPVRWKYYAVGNYYLNNVLPPRNPYI
jgi:SfnB family sulfur acquisition oxidoreductase